MQGDETKSIVNSDQMVAREIGTKVNLVVKIANFISKYSIALTLSMCRRKKPQLMIGLVFDKTNSTPYKQKYPKIIKC